jgi:hypothetical protein
MKQKVNSPHQADGGDSLKVNIAGELVHRTVLITSSRASNLAVRSLRFVAGAPGNFGPHGITQKFA